MDSIRFDRLSRLVATCTTRRTGFGVLTALALLGLAQTPTRAVPCTKPCPFCKRCEWVLKKTNTPKKRKKRQECVPKPLGTACPGGSCRFGICVCREGYRPCRGGCIANGLCCTDDDCPEGRICGSGGCACPAGTAPCGGRCCPHEG